MKKKLLSVMFSLLLSVIFISPISAQSRLTTSSRTIYKYGQFDKKVFNGFKTPKLKDPRLSCYNFCTTTNPSTFLKSSSYIASGDIDSDGKNEILSVSPDEGFIAIMHQQADTNNYQMVGLWDVNTDEGSVIGGLGDIYIKDMNNDERQDIVAFDTLNKKVYTLYQTEEFGTFEKKLSVNFNQNISRGNIGDINNDGRYDIILTAGENGYVFQNIGDDLFNPYTQQFSKPSANPHNFDKPAIDDINGDNLADVIILDSTLNKLNTWLSPSFVFAQFNGPDVSNKNFAIGDLDHDGINDIAIPGKGTNSVRVIWGGEFSFTNMFASGDFREMTDAVIGNINNQYKNSLVVTNRSGFTIHMWGFVSRGEYYQQTMDALVEPSPITLNDFNSDGSNDLAYGIKQPVVGEKAFLGMHFNSLEGNTKSDLQIAGVRHTNTDPTHMTIMPEMKALIKVKNGGNLNVSEFKVRIETLNENTFPQTITYQLTMVRNLKAGEEREIPIYLSYPNMNSITDFKVTLDPSFEVSESNESNNILQLDWQDFMQNYFSKYEDMELEK